MKWSTVTVGVMILGIIGVSIILLFQQLTTTNENDYYLLNGKDYPYYVICNHRIEPFKRKE